MKFNLEKQILDETKYKSGFNNTHDAYVISASMVAKEPLQNYLTIVHGSHDDKKIGDNTLGTVFHKGMENIIMEARTPGKAYTEGGEMVLSEHSMHTTLENGWILSGTGDLVVRGKELTSSIHDYKLTKSYALKMVNKDIVNHDWSKQVQVLDLLHKKEAPADAKHSELFLEIFIKDAKAIENENTYNQVKVPNINHEVLEAEIVGITNELQQFIENGEIPPECKDTWKRKLKNGTTIATKCALYCSHGAAGVCPYYRPDTRESVARIVNW